VNVDSHQNVSQINVSLQQLHQPDCFSQLLLSINVNTQTQEQAIQNHHMSELEDLKPFVCEEDPDNKEPFGFS
jgi:hypothetical protein